MKDKKLCPDCGRDLPLSKFRHNYINCLSCRQKEQDKKRWLGLKVQEQSKRDRRIKRNYNLTPEQWNTIFISQEGKCAICGTHQENLKRKLVVDHDHITDRVRGLLCFRCNTLVGFLEKSRGILYRALDHIDQP